MNDNLTISKNKILNTVVILSLIIIGCKSTPTATTTAAVVKNDSAAVASTDTAIKVKTTAESEKYRLVVSFYSIGEGTETKFINAFEDSIGSFSTSFGKNIDYSKNAWGREGETDFCLMLNEISSSQQSEFISRTKAMLSSAKWVNVNENVSCRHRRKS